MDLFVLEENEDYDKHCGEVFFTTKGRIVFCCSCDDKFISFKAFLAHLLDMHLPEKVDRVDDDLIEIYCDFEETDNISSQNTKKCNENNHLHCSENKNKYSDKLIEIDTFDMAKDAENSAIAGSDNIDTQIQDNQTRNNTTGNIDNFEIPIKVRAVQSRLYSRSHPTPIAERKHKCPICGFGFKSRHNMIHHLKRHTEKKDHKCLECSKEFYTSSELKIHMRCHENGQERPFLCTECGTCFYANRDLLKHMKRHSGIKNISCNICDKKFYDNDQLRSHMIIHSFHWPFVCKICKANFSGARNLRSHIKAHESSEKFTCVHCGQEFDRKILLFSHMDTNHSDM